MAPIDKEAKYDRQLRLWAANGQAALESSRIGLIHGTATGTETLKNLVLPGVGSYTIVDGARITPRDTGVNFFLDVDCIGHSRAAKVCEYLQELNSDVAGKFLDVDPVELIEDDPAYFVENFDIVLATDLDRAPLQRLAQVLWEAKIPLLVVNAVGFTGLLRIALPEHTIVETHPDAIVDLRLDVPWRELSLLAEQVDLESMNDNEHTHVPYILLLLHYLTQWKSQHGGSAPSSFEEKSQFKAMIRAGMRNVDEDNFDEAVHNVWRACGKTSLPADVEAVFASSATQNLTSTSADFWFLARAVADFVRGEGQGLLPVAGVVPDMKSDTARFIHLQKTYRAKAMSDISRVKLHLIHHLTAQNRPSTAIPDAEIESFCKHAAFIKVIRYRSLEEEFTRPNTKVIQAALEEAGAQDSPIHLYLAKQAADTIKTERGSFPGRLPDSYSDDQQILTRTALAQCGTSTTTTTETTTTETSAFVDPLTRACREMTRSGHGELHNIASFMGGVAAQEMIKIITRQYVPVNNTVVFDGIRSVTAVFEM